MNYFLFYPSQRIKFLQYACLLSLFHSNIFASKSNHNWININPQKEARVISYAPSPSHDGIVYALSPDNKLIKSLDSGATWNEIRTRARTFFPLKGIRIDANDPQILYAGNQGKLSKSSDGGVHWKNIAEDVKVVDSSFFRLNPQPMTSLLKILVWVDDEKRLAISEDKGESWKVSDHTFQKINNEIVTIEAIDPLNPEIIYAKSNEDKLYKSTNGGKNWNNPPLNDALFYRNKLIIHSNNSDLLYARFTEDLPISFFGTQVITDFFDLHGYMRSEDGGENWERLGNIENLDIFFISPLTLDPTDSNIIYANLKHDGETRRLNDLVAKSGDAGRSWTLIPIERKHFPFNSVQKIVVNPLDNQNLFYHSPLSTLVSFDGGESWRKSIALIRPKKTGVLIVAENDQNILYLHSGNQLYKSIDAGFHWSKIKEKFSCINLIINPKNNNNLLCRHHDQSGDNLLINRSFDGGINWEIIDSVNKATNFVKSSIYYAKNGETIYHIQRTLPNDHIRKSIDNGNNWSNIDIPSHIRLDINSLLIDPRNPNTIYAFTFDKRIVYKSVTGGMLWTKQLDISSSLDLVQIESRLLIHPAKSDTLLYIVQNSTFFNFLDPATKTFITDNAGNNWTELSASFNDFIDTGFSTSNIIFDPVNPLGILASLESGILYETTDLGKTWNMIIEDDIFINELFSAAGNVYSRRSNFKLSIPETRETQDCLFTWAEQNYPTLFSRPSDTTQFLDSYAYRYYQNTNTYLGVFENTNMHLLQADLTDEIKDVGFFDYFRSLAGCD